MKLNPNPSLSINQKPTRHENTTHLQAHPLHHSDESITRRVALKGGLAGLAALLVQSHLVGCDSSENQMQSMQMRTDQGSSNSTPSDLGMTIDEGDQSLMDDEENRESDMLADLDAGLPADLEAPEMDAGIRPDFPQRTLPAPQQRTSLIDSLGPLREADENGVKLPEGFSSRIIARSGEEVIPNGHRWHPAPDGGASYPTEDGGWIYVSNSEILLLGGVSAIRFNAQGEIIDAYPILERTNQNCAGGITPWHTWLSCEEVSKGWVYECSPWGDQDAILRSALGCFKHEAVAVDPIHGHLYLTEDESDGGFYRFTADQMNDLGFPDLNSGTLEVATVSEEGQVTWNVLPDPEYTGDTPTRYQVADLTPFKGGEGIWFHESVIYFSTKGDNKVWAYHTQTAQLDVIYDGEGHLSGVDNLTVSCCGDVLVAEDGGDMQIVAILPSGELKTLMQIEGQDGSEVTGPAFDPSGTRLYFSSQRGPQGVSADGITYEITGPFHQLI